MQCGDYERLIHLSGAGERTAEEEQHLARHLRTCPRCAEMQEQMERTDTYIGRLRGLSPAVPRPGLLTDRILAAIDPLPAKHARPWEVLDVLQTILMKPTVRYVYAAAIILAVGLFLYQQVSLVNSLQALERRMEEGGRLRPRASVTYTVSTESLRRTGAMGLLRPLLDSGDYRLTNGDVSVRKQTLEPYATRANLRQLRKLAYAYGIKMPDVRMESLLDELKRSAVVQLRLDAEGG
jgi:hypothetical protein